ncbi:Csu type fimbrial protein [Tatumella ptyseos]|uniref:Csu type fimbrial protein n=1 Tax=Tatumella ptyseos TaxID=82987 RepID=UPI0023F57028|nr:spore coat U domain-containing protein [Tatumella ptyseos]
MKLRKTLLITLGCALTTALTSLSASATEGTLTGQVGVEVTIKEGCTVANGSSSSGTNSWGTLNFGTYADLTSIINGSVLGSGGKDAVTVTCTAGLSPTLTLDGGLNESGNVRNMVNTTTTSGTTTSSDIAYHLYSDASYDTEIKPGTSISLTASGDAQSIPIYGRILPTGQSSTAPASGTYTDTVTATLAW